jgi:hypothetical protein
VRPRQIAQRVEGITGPVGTPGGVIESLIASIPLDTGPLRTALERLWADSWLAGAKDASGHGVSVQKATGDALEGAVNAVDWSAWAPGRVHGTVPGLENVSQQLGGLIKGISDHTRDLIVSLVEAFVAGRVAHVPWTDADVTELAEQIGLLINDPDRAALISRTEVNRAMTTASVDLFKRAGIAMFDLLNHVGACPVCVDIKDANPHPISDASAMPPIHPRCRCSVAPARSQR